MDRESHPPTPPDGVSRRSFIQTLGLSAAAGAVARDAEAVAQQVATGPTVIGPDAATVKLRINGNEVSTSVEPATTLLETLRYHVGMTGSKEICDRGSCGGCSVMVDGQLVASCMMLASDAIGSDVQTVEGLANGEALNPLQESFIKHDALQCGFCTPGFLMAAQALLDKNPKPTLDEIKRGLAGNICRCGTYTNMFNAVLEASGQDPIVDGGGA